MRVNNIDTKKKKKKKEDVAQCIRQKTPSPSLTTGDHEDFEALWIRTRRFTSVLQRHN